MTETPYPQFSTVTVWRRGVWQECSSQVNKPTGSGVVWGAMGHCHGSPGAVRRAEPTAACRSLWSANWYPDCSPLRITSVSLLNEPTLKKSSQIFHLNVFCLVFRKEKELTHPGFIGLNLPHRSFPLPRSSQNVTVRRRKNVTKFGGRGEAAMWQHPLVGLSAQASFFCSKILCSSSASSLVFTRISMVTGTVGCFSSSGGLGTQTMRTLFFPVRVHGILGGIRTFSSMLPLNKQKKIFIKTTYKNKCINTIGFFQRLKIQHGNNFSRC